MKKVFYIIGSIIVAIALIFFALLIINRSYSKSALDVNILENGSYYSKSFEVSKDTVYFESNIDCAIEIINIDNEDDSVSIGYLTPGMSESLHLSKNKKYRIKSDVNSDKLVITIKGIKK